MPPTLYLKNKMDNFQVPILTWRLANLILSRSYNLFFLNSSSSSSNNCNLLVEGSQILLRKIEE